MRGLHRDQPAVTEKIMMDSQSDPESEGPYGKSKEQEDDLLMDIPRIHHRCIPMSWRGSRSWTMCRKCTLEHYDIVALAYNHTLEAVNGPLESHRMGFETR